MEFTIKKIIDIDKDAENYRINMDKVLIDKKKQLEKTLEQMKFEADESILKEKKEYMGKKDEDTRYNIEIIKKRREEQLKRLRNIYLEYKESIIEKCFNEIINSYQSLSS